MLRRRHVAVAISLAATLGLGGPALAAEAAPGSPFNVYWDKGLNFATADKQYHLKLGARIQNDWAVLDPANDLADSGNKKIDGLQTGTEFRRARLQLAGTFYEFLDFKAEYEFASGKLGFRDVYLGARNVPVIGRFQIGHFKEPFSLEQITSDSFTTFMERSLADALTGERNVGLAFYRTFADERVVWAGGAFRDTNNDSAADFTGDARYNVTTRVTGLPWYEDKGRRLLHLGVGYSHRIRNNDSVGFEQRPESHLASKLVAVEVQSDGVDLVNPEIALVVGPFSAQAEYMHAFNNAVHGSNQNFDGYYVMVSYFITGENRPYKTSDGIFDRVQPKKNFLDGGNGPGAFEVAVRYSAVDFTDEAAHGGELNDVTAGVNWYLNPFWRVSVNYVHADRSPGGEANIGEARFQLDF